MMKFTALIFASLMIFFSACNTKSKKSMPEIEEGFLIERGLNVSHWLSQTEIRGEERARYMGAEDFVRIAEMGFDHVRIPIDEEQMWDEQGKRNEDAFELLHKAINWSFESKLRVIVDLHVLRSHHFNSDDIQLWTDPLAQEQFWGFWEELSAELIEYPVDKLAYELMNEAVADDSEDWNRLIAKGIEVVRVNEPERVIVVGSNKWQQVGTFKDLKVPEDDPNLILSFHFYSPMAFTHYKAPWSKGLKDYTGEVTYPGFPVDTAVYSEYPAEVVQKLKESNANWNAELMESEFKKAKAVADRYALPLYCGEFGCYPSTSLELRHQYYEDIISVFDKLDISWTHWNYKNDFPVVDGETLEPIDLIVSALID
ncbi:MAG: cellulase family glycosylhydrolase [Bacteroides sp.]|nr:cellulase family glycosylhydrolase [Bacteroides sp.]